jgi:hypothetical protein
MEEKLSHFLTTQQSFEKQLLFKTDFPLLNRQSQIKITSSKTTIVLKESPTEMKGLTPMVQILFPQSFRQ